MRKTAFFALSIATVLVSKQRAPESERAQSALFPGLAEHINDVARIEVKSKDGHTTVRKDGERWVIEDRGGYPALFDKVKATVACGSLRAGSLARFGGTAGLRLRYPFRKSTAKAGFRSSTHIYGLLRFANISLFEKS